MTAKTIAVANMKGGVGKTTTVVALAETFAAVGTTGNRLNVLVVDLDAQANASYAIAGDELLTELIEEGKTIEVLFKRAILKKGERSHIDDYIRSQASSMRAGRSGLISLSLVPSSPELRFVEREIIYGLTERKYSLRAIEGQVTKLILGELDRIKDRFDVIIFDCPPGISAFTEAVLKASDIIIVPVIPDVFSTLGLQAFCHRVLAASRADKGVLRLPWVLANRVNNTTVATNKLREMEAEAAAEDRGFNMLRTRIPQMPALVAAMDTVDGAPTYATKYGDARDKLMDLAKEVIEAINAA